ncbi:MAG TPA: recombinase family protein [Proteiniclasticum sp.]|uniref:recombinase family protein n=1 Tax=Proteiniclasticum sp. TaxID=2053595 RepID=UPI000E9A4CBB|nr:recombinase family protein [Proteiniclasticum sp.]HBW13819.1 recombinase family protein [Proteiniclasticum sp.]
MKVVSYSRYSSDNQREESIEAQQRAINKYCEDKGYTLTRNYIDLALSATNDNRPEFQKMISDSKSGLFQAVVVHKLDRFARNRYDSAIYGRKLQQNGVKVISVMENLDDSPESIILRSVIEGYNEYYSLNLARETMKGLKENAYTARHNGGQPPYGYSVGPDKKYIINPSEAEAVRVAYKLYCDGLGYIQISNALDELGYRTRTGKRFSKNTIYDMLGNEKYTGVYVYNKRASTSNGIKQNRKHKDPEDIIRIEDGMPAIISKNDYEKVMHMRNKNKRIGGKYKSEEYALSGIIKCGKCGGAMVGNKYQGGRDRGTLYVTYQCSTRKRTKGCDMKSINRDYIESEVYLNLKEEILDKLETKEFQINLANRMDEGGKELKIKLLSSQKKLDDINKQLENIVNAVSAGMDPTVFIDKSNDLNKQKQQLMDVISSAKFEIIEESIQMERVRDTIKRAEIDKDLTALFKAVIREVVVTEDDFVVEYLIMDRV